VPHRVLFEWILREKIKISISPLFYEQFFRHSPFAKKIETKTKKTEKNCITIAPDKAARKTLVKLT